MEKALLLLRKIGMRSTYKGYNYFATAISLTVSDSEYLNNVTKNMYVVVGEHYKTHNYCVEAAIRTLINNYWNQHQDTILYPLLGFPLYDKPSTSEFISILADFIRDNPNLGRMSL